MVEHRYRDNAEAVLAQGSNNLLKRLGQRKTTQTSPTRFNSALYGRRKNRKEGGRRYFRCVRVRGNTLVCVNMYIKRVCGEHTGQKIKRRRKNQLRGSSEMETGVIKGICDGRVDV